MAKEIRSSQGLGENISNHVLGADIGDGNGAALLHLARVVVSQIDVLAGCAVDGIVRHGDSALAIAEKIDGSGKARVPDFTAEHLVPLSFLSGLSRTAVFAVIGAGSDIAVQLAVPADRAASKKKT